MQEKISRITRRLIPGIITLILVALASTGSITLLFSNPVNAATSLEITPNPCLPGEFLEVYGSGFTYSLDKKCPVGLYLDDLHVGNVYPDKSGAFTYSLEALSSPGDYLFGAIQDCDGGSAFVTLMVRDLPAVETRQAQKVTSTSAYLRGYLNDTGGSSEVECGFEYGVDSKYGDYVQAAALSGPAEFGCLVEGLIPGTTYHFRARAEGSDFEGMDFGSDLTFATTIDTVAKPKNLLPEQGKQDVSLLPVFEWTEVQQAVAYEFQLALDSDFDTLLVDIETGDATYISAAELDYDTIYYWRARAVGSTDVRSAWCVSDFRTLPEDISIPQATDSPQLPSFPPTTTSTPPPWLFDPPETTNPPPTNPTTSFTSPQPTDSPYPPNPAPTTLPSPQLTVSITVPDVSDTPEVPAGPFPTTGIALPPLTISPTASDLSDTSTPFFPTTGAIQIYPTDSPYPPNAGYTLRASISGYGQVSGEGIYPAGTVVDIVATMTSEEWYFDRWTGDISTLDDPLKMNTSITLNDNCTITAVFKQAGSSGLQAWIIGIVIGGIVLISAVVFILFRQRMKKGDNPA